MAKRAKKAKKSKKATPKTDWMQKLVDKQLALIEQGKLVWQKPICIDGEFRNMKGTIYHGVNIMNLSMDMMLNDWICPVFITTTELKKRKIEFKHLAGTGVHSSILRWVSVGYSRKARDTQGHVIVDEDTGKDTYEQASRKTLAYVGTVWNIELFPALYEDWQAGEGRRLALVANGKKQEAEDVIQTFLSQCTFTPAFEHKYIVSTRGFISGAYSPATHTVTVSPMKDFVSSEAYYNVVFHELGHATGHNKLLARKGVAGNVQFGSHEYSLEELVAEFTASFLCYETGVSNTVAEHNSAAYIQGWWSALKNDKTLLTKAVCKAQDAFYLITGKTREEFTAEDDTHDE